MEKSPKTPGIIMLFAVLVFILPGVAMANNKESEIAAVLNDYGDLVRAKQLAVIFIQKHSPDGKVSFEQNFALGYTHGRPSHEYINTYTIKRDLDRARQTTKNLAAYLQNQKTYDAKQSANRAASKLRQEQSRLSDKASPTTAKPSTQLPNLICQVPEGKAREDLKRKLFTTYKEHYATIKMLLDSGMRDYHVLCDVPDSEPHRSVLSRLKRVYYPHFSTILMLYKENMKAYQALQ